jgi:preprotein translocase SecE subunit
MSRAVRRQQAAPPKDRSPRPTKLGLGGGGSGNTRQARGARAPQDQRKGFRLRAPRIFDDIFSELKKVTWPTAAETRYLTGVVVVVALTVGAALGLIDIFFNWLIDQLLLK